MWDAIARVTSDLIEEILQRMPEFLKARREAKQTERLHKVGIALFRLFADLNDVLIYGRMIVAKLRGGDTHALRYMLLPRQGENVRRVRETIYRLSGELNLVSPEAYERLVPRIEAEVDILAYLERCLTASNPSVVFFDQPITDGLTWVDDEDFGRFRMIQRERREISFEPDPTSDAIKITETRRCWPPYYNPDWWLQRNQRSEPEPQEIDHSAINRYLETAAPEARLAEIEEALKSLREALLKHFTVEDMLADVGQS